MRALLKIIISICVFLVAPRTDAQIFDATLLVRTYSPELYFTWFIETGDLNQDGIQDLWTVSFTGQLTIWFGSGDGSFAQGQTTDGYSYVGFFSVEDIDHDGIPDAVNCPAYVNTVSVRLGNRNGTLTPLPDVNIPSPMYSAALEDIDSDGNLDIIGASDSSVLVLIGDGAGHFNLIENIPLGRPVSSLRTFKNKIGNAVNVVFALPTDSAIATITCDGLGNFSPPVIHEIGRSATALALGDINADENQDIAVIDSGVDSIIVLHCNESGGFADRSAYHLSYRPTALVASDFDGDGDDDLAIAFRHPNNSGDVSVLLAEEGGLTEQSDLMPLRYYRGELEVADMNNDGALDILVANGGGGAVAILFGHRDGTFGYTHRPKVTKYTGAPFTADLDNDGNNDLLLESNSPDRLSALYGDGQGGFQLSQIAASNEIDHEVVSDFDNDGLEDIVMSLWPERIVQFLHNEGGRIFSTATTIDSGLTQLPYRIAGDVDGDGNQDIIEEFQFDPIHAELRYGHGDGTFEGPLTLPAGIGLPLVVNDLNIDGRPDILCGNRQKLHALIGDSTHGFRDVTTDVPGYFLYRGKTADLDEDGILDFVYTSETQNGSYVNASFVTLAGSGDGTFHDPSETSFGYRAGDFRLADVNGDGHVDVLYIETDREFLAVYKGKGDRTFSLPECYETGSWPYSFVITDLNNDGHKDVVGTNYMDTSLSVYWGSQRGPSSCCFGHVGNVDCDPAGQVDMSDVTAMVDYLFVGFGHLCCSDAADLVRNAEVDIADLTGLIDYLFISFSPLSACK